MLESLRFKRSPEALASKLEGERWFHARHLVYLSDVLRTLPNTKDRRIIVSMPPRHGKSTLSSHYFPAWYLEHRPEHKIILTTYEADFSAQWGRRVRDTIEQNPDLFTVGVGNVRVDEVKSRWHRTPSASHRWETHAGGGMITAGIGGGITGKGCHVLIVDDALKNAEEANSVRTREKQWDWWSSTAYTRLEPGGHVIIVMTRWHEDDLPGRIMRHAAGSGENWELISLPALAEENDLLGRRPGEALFPERFPVETLLKIKNSVSMKPTDWLALYQQRPSSISGNVVQRGWMKFYKTLPADLDETISAWDMSFKDNVGNDPVAGQLWSRKGANKYLRAEVHGVMDYPASKRAVLSFSARFPEAYAKLVEDKANGSAIIADLKNTVPGLIPWPAETSMNARFSAVSTDFEAGNVWLPDPSIAPWVHDYIEEIVNFPRAPHDDRVASTVIALERFRQGLAQVDAGPEGLETKTSYWRDM